MTAEGTQDLQELCATGQELLIATDYLRAEATLENAERLAWAAADWDALSRLYMPLQEPRRQRRQRCGEGTIRLDLVARRPSDALNAEQIISDHPHGQLLITGWGSIAPA